MRIPPFQKISQVLAISVTELLIGEKPQLQELIDELEEIELQMRKLRAQLNSVI